MTLQNKQIRLVAFLIILFLPQNLFGQSTESEAKLIERARAIHNRVLTLDGHVDIPMIYATEEADPGQDNGYQVNLPNMRSGGLDAAFFIVYVGQAERNDSAYAEAWRKAMVKFDAIHRMTDELYPNEIGLAYKASDIDSIAVLGQKVALIGIENGYVIGKDLSKLQRAFDLGARYITLAHAGHNDICDSATPKENFRDESAGEHNGVSDFGEKVIAEMNRLGIMVDVSHISSEAMFDAIRLSKAPIIASHSSCAGLVNHRRNLTDDQLLAIRDNGGLAMMVAVEDYIKSVPAEKMQTIEALNDQFGLPNLGLTVAIGLDALTEDQKASYQQKRAEFEITWPPADVSNLVDHIDHAVKIAGINHVGITSDFDGGGGINGWDSAGETFNVTLEMVRRGYSEEEIALIWSGNLIRVLSEVEKIAQR